LIFLLKFCSKFNEVDGIEYFSKDNLTFQIFDTNVIKVKTPIIEINAINEWNLKGNIDLFQLYLDQNEITDESLCFFEYDVSSSVNDDNFYQNLPPLAHFQQIINKNTQNYSLIW
jgi:hypothetical protein